MHEQTFHMLSGPSLIWIIVDTKHLMLLIVDSDWGCLLESKCFMIAYDESSLLWSPMPNEFPLEWMYRKCRFGNAHSGNLHFFATIPACRTLVVGIHFLLQRHRTHVLVIHFSCHMFLSLIWFYVDFGTKAIPVMTDHCVTLFLLSRPCCCKIAFETASLTLFSWVDRLRGRVEWSHWGNVEASVCNESSVQSAKPPCTT